MTCFYVRACNAALGVALLLGSVASSSAATIVLGPAVSFDSLLVPGGSITVGDKEFTDFTYATTGTMPTANGVNVIPIQDSDGNFGIRFQGGFVDLPGGNASDAAITYNVTTTDPLFLISGAHIAANVAAQGPSLAQVTESFLPPFPTVNMTVSDSPGGTMMIDDVAFSTPVQTLPVQKGILLFADGGGFATMSFVDQTFSQVVIAEPATLGLAGLASLFLGMVYMRRRLG